DHTNYRDSLRYPDGPFRWHYGWHRARLFRRGLVWSDDRPNFGSGVWALDGGLHGDSAAAGFTRTPGAHGRALTARRASQSFSQRRRSWWLALPHTAKTFFSLA